MNTILRITLIIALLPLTNACTSFREVIADGPVVEDYGVRTRGTELEDSDIESKIRVNIRFTPSLQQANIQVNSYNRVVLLTGQVPDAGARQKVADIAKNTRQVRSIHNELEVGQPLGLLEKSADSLLHTKITARLMASEDIDSGRVVVIVENSVVYLMGLVTQDESRRIINTTKEVSGIRKIVKVFEYID